MKAAFRSVDLRRLERSVCVVIVGLLGLGDVGVDLLRGLLQAGLEVLSPRHFSYSLAVKSWRVSWYGRNR
ncbi:hypothetical protein SMICM304S_01353 [Streptomyces microflavus]